MIKAAAAEILESTELPLLLQTVLAIGNHLNSVRGSFDCDTLPGNNVIPIAAASSSSFARTPVRDRSWAMPKHSDSAAFSNLRTTRAPTRNSHCSATLSKPSRLRRLAQTALRSVKFASVISISEVDDAVRTLDAELDAAKVLPSSPLVQCQHHFLQTLFLQTLFLQASHSRVCYDSRS